METPTGQRREVEEYLRSQFGPDFAVEHVEKLTSEFVLGRQYDVWDAHTNEGRWWVITPPTNLYSQDQVRSMDIVLSFHIGLMSRMETHNPVRFNEGDDRTWILEVLRRIETAGENLDRAKEVEDVQAVGMRLREALLSLIAKMREAGVGTRSTATLPEQNGNFKGWAEVYANALAAGSTLDRLRKMLKSQSDCTWEYLGWLTHARNANHLDGRLALCATNALVELFLFALARADRESQERCPACSSYQLGKQMAPPGEGWLLVCSTCGWSRPTDPPGRLGEETETQEDEQPVEGDCVPLEDLDIYVTPGQTRAALIAAAEAARDEDERPSWANPFAFRFPEDESIHDAHRLVYTSFKEEPAVGTELVYGCEEGNCVNPEHATADVLSEVDGWRPTVVERVTVKSPDLELVVSGAPKGRRTVLLPAESLNRFGMGDASSLLERVVFVSEGASPGQVLVVPAVRRVNLSDSSVLRGRTPAVSDEETTEGSSSGDADTRPEI